MPSRRRSAPTHRLVEPARGRARRGAAIACAVVLALLVSGPPAAAQDFFNQRDDEYVLLGLKRAQRAFEIARTEFERQEELFDQGLISASALDQARRFFSEAEVNYQQSVLASLFEGQYVAVRRAVKQRATNGRKSVVLEIENTAGGGAELGQLAGWDDELFRALAPDRIHDVYVSLLNDDGAIISQPYEAKLEELAYGEPARLSFDLLQDLDAVTVAISYGKAGQRQVKVFLQRDESENRVAIQPVQFSQEVGLGTEAVFELGLELFSGSDDTYRLAVLGLPDEINRYFSDPVSGARLRQIRFTEAAEARRALLTVALPDRASEAVPLARTMEFYVVAVPETRIADLERLEGGVEPAELAGSGFGWARLELLARGLGDLVVAAPQLFHRIQPGETVEVVVDLKNEGSAELRNIEVDVDPPLGWTRSIEPRLVPRLAVGEEARVRLTLAPGSDPDPGRYESRLRSKALSESQPIDGEDKLLTIEISPQVSLFGTGAILLLIVGLVGGLVFFGIRLARQ